MKPKRLAEIEGFARIERCGECEDLHVTLGPLSFRICESAFDRFLSMLRQAQSELQLEQGNTGNAVPTYEAHHAN